MQLARFARQGWSIRGAATLRAIPHERGAVTPTPWKSATLLYLTAYLAERLTDVRRLVIVRGAEFVGLLSTSIILATLPGMPESLRKVHHQLAAGPPPRPTTSRR